VEGAREEAERRLAVIVGDLAAGRWADPQQITVSELANDWLETVAATVRPSTLEGYGQKLRCACRWIGGQRIARVSGRMLTDLYRRMLDRYTAQSVVHVHRVLHRMFSDAVRWQLLGRNPAAEASPPRLTRRRLDVWTAPQVSQFLEVVAEHRCGPLFRLAVTTGMRRGELLGLRWPHVDLARGRLDVVAATVMVRGRPQTSEPKTTSGRRRIALDPETVRLLAEHRDRQDADREFFAGSYRDGGWVFCWEDGRPWSPDWVSRQFRQSAIGCGLPPIRFHDLRHTWATMALDAGVPAKVVADRLGHAGIAITLDLYTHHSDELDRRAADQVAGLFTRDGTRDTSGTPDDPACPPVPIPPLLVATEGEGQAG
jgi:integrase